MEGPHPGPAVVEGCQCGYRRVQPSCGFPGVVNVSQQWASPDQLVPTWCAWLGWEESPAGGEGQSATCKERGPGLACADARPGRSFSHILQTDLHRDCKQSQSLGSSWKGVRALRNSVFFLLGQSFHVFIVRILMSVLKFMFPR